MSSKNNQSSAGQFPKNNREPSPEDIAKTRMPGDIEQKQRLERAKGR